MYFKLSTYLALFSLNLSIISCQLYASETPDKGYVSISELANIYSLDKLALIRQVKGKYPPLAQRDGKEGWVELEFDIGSTGSIDNLRVVEAQPKRIFDREAKRAIRKWVFELTPLKRLEGLRVKMNYSLVNGVTTTYLLPDFGKGFEFFKQEKYIEALPYLSKAAEQGNANAQYNLGLMYRYGWAVTQNNEAAANWYKKAAAQGHANAQFDLEAIYQKENDVTQDYNVALSRYKKDAEQGDAEAQYNLGLIYENGQGVIQDYKVAASWYKKAAEQGYANAQFNLGVMYIKGRGVTKDFKTTVSWFKKAAEQGHANAQFNLGIFYNNSLGVPLDHKAAFSWFKKSAEQGFADAQFSLGHIYHQGNGINQDLNTAVSWYSKAAEQGHEEAIKRYADLKVKLNCISKAKTKLFDVALKCADSQDLWSALRSAGVRWDYIDDIYYTEDVLKGSSTLELTYTETEQFANAKYTFPYKKGTNQLLELLDLISNKYGQPDLTDSKKSSPKLKYKWYLEDGIEIEISREWPEAPSYLSYVYPDNYRVVLKAKQDEDYQSNAF